MKEITPKDTRYVPFTQQNSCCVPTSIIIIMYKLGIPLVSQELLGHHLGLILGKKDKHLFWNVRTGKKPPTGYGVWFKKGKYDFEIAFKKLKIPLKAIAYPILDFKTKKELVSFISDGIKKDKNFMVFLASDVLNGSKNNRGHACIVDRIYSVRDTIRLIDPSSKRAKWRELKIDKFIKAVKLHPTGKGRLVELKKIK